MWMEDCIEEESGSPRCSWPRSLIGHTDSDLTFALHLSLSELNLQSLVRPPSRVSSVAQQLASQGTRRVVKLRVGMKGASRALHLPPSSRRVSCLMLLRFLLVSTAATVVLALASGAFSTGAALRAVRGGQCAALDPRSSRGGASSMGIDFGLGDILLTDDLELAVVTLAAEAMRRGCAVVPPGAALDSSATWNVFDFIDWKDPTCALPYMVGCVAVGLENVHEKAPAPTGAFRPIASPMLALARLRAHLLPLSYRGECTLDHSFTDVPPRPVVALVGILGAAMLALASPGGSAEAEAALRRAGSAANHAVPPALPAGFDITTATFCAELSGLAYTMNGSVVDYERLHVHLSAMHLKLVDAVDVEGNFAYIARRGNDIYLVFRGSCNCNNVRTDLDFDACTETLSTYAKISGVTLPDGIRMHSGFLAAWLAMRERVVATIDALTSPVAPPGTEMGESSREGTVRMVDDWGDECAADEGGGGADSNTSTGSSSICSGQLKLFVTGHSMGGAIGQLAAWEIAQRLRNGEPRNRCIHRTYTFAAPRLGNVAFARHFDHTFPRAADHWALQAAADAVPHLPFAAWGFHHPDGVLKLGAMRVQRSGDMGDHPRFLKPKDGNVKNWVASHDMKAYVIQLASLACASGFSTHCEVCRATGNYNDGMFAPHR